MRASPIARALILSLLAPVPVAAASDAPPEEEDFWLGYLPGRFALVGQEPDGGKTYSGTAAIVREGDGFSLTRTLGSRTLRARGDIEVPHPPGEGKVLRFRWREGEDRSMTCLVGNDLDNYPRLTCFWGVGDRNHVAPGLEAYFSTETWPERR